MPPITSCIAPTPPGRWAPPAPHTHEDGGREPVVDQPVAHGVTSPCPSACACRCLQLPARRFMEAAGGAAAPAMGTAPRGLSPEKPLRKCWVVSKATFQEGTADPISQPKPAPCACWAWPPAEGPPGVGAAGHQVAPLLFFFFIQYLGTKMEFFFLKVGIFWWEGVAESPSCAWLSRCAPPQHPSPASAAPV